VAGGETCRAKFKDFLGTAFKVSGLGKVNFPGGAFGTANFHCGYYVVAGRKYHKIRKVYFCNNSTFFYSSDA